MNRGKDPTGYVATIFTFDWQVFPANKNESGQITALDFSGFMGDMPVKRDYAYFEEFVESAKKLAEDYCQLKNKQV